MLKPKSKSIDPTSIKFIAKNYNTLDYKPKLTELLIQIYPNENFDSLSKYELHKAINKAIVEKYKGELNLKYCLFQQFKKQNLVAAFEIRVNNSRADFLTINGRTTSF